jgi:nucleolar protein 9
LLEIEGKQDMAATPLSLMDRVLFGIITGCRAYPTCISPSQPEILKICSEKGPGVLPEPSDYVNTLLRDPTSSHLLETVIRSAPEDVFAVLWLTYFRGHLVRLANHPVANFVVAKALERTSSEQLGEALRELEGTWQKSISKRQPCFWSGRCVSPMFRKQQDGGAAFSN